MLSSGPRVTAANSPGATPRWFATAVAVCVNNPGVEKVTQCAPWAQRATPRWDAVNERGWLRSACRHLEHEGIVGGRYPRLCPHSATSEFRAQACHVEPESSTVAPL